MYPYCVRTTIVRQKPVRYPSAAFVVQKGAFLAELTEKRTTDGPEPDLPPTRNHSGISYMSPALGDPDQMSYILPFQT